jgi:hypothetical protein
VGVKRGHVEDEVHLALEIERDVSEQRRGQRDARAPKGRVRVRARARVRLRLGVRVRIGRASVRVRVRVRVREAGERPVAIGDAAS